MPIHVAAASNAARHHHNDDNRGRGNNGWARADSMRYPEDLLRQSVKSAVPGGRSRKLESRAADDTPQVSCSLLQKIINSIYDKRRIKRSPITPWMVEGSFNPDDLVGKVPPPKERLKEGLMHKLGKREL
jgi:hypothetical protein